MKKWKYDFGKRETLLRKIRAIRQGLYVRMYV